MTKPKASPTAPPNIQPINRFNPFMQLTAAKTQNIGFLLSYNKMFATETDFFPYAVVFPEAKRLTKPYPDVFFLSMSAEAAAVVPPFSICKVTLRSRASACA